MLRFHGAACRTEEVNSLLSGESLQCRDCTNKTNRMNVMLTRYRIPSGSVRRNLSCFESWPLFKPPDRSHVGPAVEIRHGARSSCFFHSIETPLIEVQHPRAFPRQVGEPVRRREKLPGRWKNRCTDDRGNAEGGICSAQTIRRPPGQNLGHNQNEPQTIVSG